MINSSARDEDELVAKTAFLAKRQDRLEQIRANAIRLGRPHATEEICKRVLERWQGHSGNI